MKMYLLDTNIISEPSKPEPNHLVTDKIFENIEYSAICSVVWAEALAGVKSMPDGKRKERRWNYWVNHVQRLYEILPFTDFAASIYADLMARLKEKGTVLPKLDLMIAATAISNNLILVTRNITDFKPIQEVSNLMLENWFEE